MTENCKNCSEIIASNFCANCGQKKYKRISKHYIFEELQYTFLHMNKGFLYSVKNIIKNPGKTAREFVDGNRVNHYKPILLAFILSGISAFISIKIIGLIEIMGDYYTAQKQGSQFMTDYLTFTKSYNSFLMLATIPFFALTTKIAFRKWGHNYYEHVVINTYFLSFYTLAIIIIQYPIMYFLRHSNPNTVITMSSYFMLLVPIMLTWFFKNFYPEKPLKTIIGRVVITLLLVLAVFLFVMIIALIIGFIYAAINGPEAIKYVQPT
jgi:hypothetical protein